MFAVVAIKDLQAHSFVHLLPAMDPAEEEETTAEAPLSQESCDFAVFCNLLAREVGIRARSLEQLATVARMEPSRANTAKLIDYMYIFVQFGQRIATLRDMVVHVSESAGTQRTLQEDVRDDWDMEVGYPPGKHCIMGRSLERLWKHQYTFFDAGQTQQNVDALELLMTLAAMGARS